MKQSVVGTKITVICGLLVGTLSAPAWSQPKPASAGGSSLQVHLRADETPPVMPLTGKIKAYTIDGTGQMMPGQFADGFIGDFVLENDLVRAVIAKPDKKPVNAAGGGNLIDLASQKQPIDYINFLQAIGDLDSTESQVQYTEAVPPQVVKDTTATLAVRGTFAAGSSDSAERPRIDVTTTYALPKNSNRLLISTRFTNNTTAPVTIAPGDVADWGAANTFLEGVGMLGNVSEQDANYVLATAEDFSVGYITSGTKPLVGLHTPRNSVVQAVPVRRQAPPATPPSASPTAPSTRPGAPRIVAPEEFPEQPDRPPFYPPPGLETRIGPSPIIQPPRPETPFNPAGLSRPAAAVTTSAMVIPSRDSVDYDRPRAVPGGDGERFPTDSASQASESQTTAPLSGDAATTAGETGGRITLAPGESFTFDRYLVVSDSDFSRIANAAYELKNIAKGTVVGIVLEAGTDTPLAGAEVLVSGGPDWDRRTPPPAFTKTSTRSDGAYVLRLPVGHYILTPTKTGRITASGPSSVEVTTGTQPRIVPLTMSRESVLRVAVSEADTPTSVPLPSKITFVAKPGTMPVNWGSGPAINKGIRNVFYMPYGAAVIPVTPGRYQITVSRGIEYGIQQGELTIVPGSDQKLEFSLPHSLKGQLPGMISVDAGIMTSASAVGTVSAADRVVQAVAEGVSVIVTGDYGVATDLQPEIERMGLQKHVKSLPGMRLLVEKEGQAANLLLYPVTQDIAGRINRFIKDNTGVPPDVLIADLRKQFPDLILQVDTPLDTQQGYLTQFPFDTGTRRFEEGVLPPSDFDAVQVIDGKKWPLHAAMLPRYEEMTMARTREAGARPLSGIGSSASRLAYGEEVGYPRTYVYTRNNTVESFTADDLVRAIRGQHYVVTNGPVLTVSVRNPKTGEFDAIPGDVVDNSTTDTVAARINVVAAPWVPFSNFDLLFNGLPVDKTEVMPTTRVLRYPVQADPNTAVRRRTLESDMIVTGFSLSSRRSLSPVVPPSPIDFGGEVYPLAWTGPIYVDKDGDGRVVVPEKKPLTPPAPDAQTTETGTVPE